MVARTNGTIAKDPLGDRPERASQVERTSPSEGETLRQHCRGMMPLDAIWPDWMMELLRDAANETSLLRGWLKQWGSPLNVLNVDPMRRAIRAIQDVASDRGLPVQLHFARKANKCPEFVQAGLGEGIGFDVASEPELQQTLEVMRKAAASPQQDRLVCTASIKSHSLMRLCVENDVVLVIDNPDELQTLRETLEAMGSSQARVALRWRPDSEQAPAFQSRFGMPMSAWSDEAKRIASEQRIKLVGVHFHFQRSLSQFDPIWTRTRIAEALVAVDHFREWGNDLRWLDIGGGFPINYLRNASQWSNFLSVSQNDDSARRLTWDGQLLRNVDPMWQPWSAAKWLGDVLQSETVTAIRSRDLILKCEPGRSLLDGCGMTLAEVAFVKPCSANSNSQGDHWIGLHMNSSQCRTTRDEFLVDPIVLPMNAAGPRGRALEGFFVGAYCTESEYLFQRRFQFPNGIARGDLVAIPNTAAYQMHFQESQAHQMPLANHVFTGNFV
ncbi:alanine racemase [Rhodopirellula halodulae]|uniref:alanine racemase n=1 Tax=Rhodopirellula halodulae TaxID=2894198 RepID=UPI001E515DAA|nr:alanine racemase [Rhodopirellula sp. JC737]MCC9656637.1 alanine racemase [Rhodopirellula sp. JC737]